MLMVNVGRFILIDCCDWTAAKWAPGAPRFTKLARPANLSHQSEEQPLNDPNRIGMPEKEKKTELV